MNSFNKCLELFFRGNKDLESISCFESIQYLERVDDFYKANFLLAEIYDDLGNTEKAILN